MPAIIKNPFYLREHNKYCSIFISLNSEESDSDVYKFKAHVLLEHIKAELADHFIRTPFSMSAFVNASRYSGAQSSCPLDNLRDQPEESKCTDLFSKFLSDNHCDIMSVGPGDDKFSELERAY